MTRKPIKRTAARKPQVAGNATQPRPQSGSFYQPAEDVGHVASPLAMHAASVRAESTPLEDGGSIDVTLHPDYQPDAPDMTSEIARIRKMRHPLGAFTQKLALEARRGYHRHWFNDVPGRLSDALNNGWAHIKGPEGQPIKRVVGAGKDNGALFAYAMEIPEVFWLEDMAARHKDAAQRVEALKASPFRAPAGTAKAADRGKFYDPSEHDAGPLQVVKGV